MSPIYPYRCSCGYAEDIYRQTSAAGELLRDHPPLCARCGKPMKRIPGAVSIQFRGPGWTSGAKESDHAE